MTLGDFNVGARLDVRRRDRRLVAARLLPSSVLRMQQLGWRVASTVGHAGRIADQIWLRRTGRARFVSEAVPPTNPDLRPGRSCSIESPSCFWADHNPFLARVSLS